MSEFELSEENWQAAARELLGLGRAPAGAELRELNIICSTFVLMRGTGLSDRNSPKQQKAAWDNVVKAAKSLDKAIRGLKAVNCSFDALDDHGADSRSFHQSLTLVTILAGHVGHLEGQGPKTPPRIDTFRDYLIEALIGFWVKRGGRRSISMTVAGEPNGPLLRFLQATLLPTLAEVDEPPPQPHAIREMVRRPIRRAVEEEDAHGEINHGIRIQFPPMR